MPGPIARSEQVLAHGVNRSQESRQEILQAVPLRLNDVGEGLLLVQLPLKPIEVEAPGASEPL